MHEVFNMYDASGFVARWGLGHSHSGSLYDGHAIVACSLESRLREAPCRLHPTPLSLLAQSLCWLSNLSSRTIWSFDIRLFGCLRWTLPFRPISSREIVPGISNPDLDARVHLRLPPWLPVRHSRFTAHARRAEVSDATGRIGSIRVSRLLPRG